MGSVKPSQPEKGASVLGLLYNVYIIKSGILSLHRKNLWVHGGSRDCWDWLGQSRNKHPMNIINLLSQINSKLNAFKNIFL